MEEKFYRKILKNGMTVLFEKRDLPVVSVGIAVRCGGINEGSAEKGISHFIEHMLFKGTKKRDVKEIVEVIEKNGGKINAVTDENITAYYCKMPSNHLDLALDVLIDMVKDPLFDEKEMEKERNVIFEEIKMRRDNPAIYVLDKLNSFLYEEPFGINLIGNNKTMNSIDRKKILERFKKVYTPNNLVLCVVGNADFDHILDFAEKSFENKKGEIPRFEIRKKSKSSIETRKGLDQANLAFAYHVPLAKDKKNHAAHVLSALMALGMSSRLFIEIREKRNLAYSVVGSSEINKDYAYNLIHVGTSKENLNEVKELILEEFEKVSKELEEFELNQVKEQLLGNHYISLEESLAQMMNLLLYEINGDAKEFYEYEKNIKQVKLKDVQDLAGNVKKNYSFFALVPE